MTSTTRLIASAAIAVLLLAAPVGAASVTLTIVGESAAAPRAQLSFSGSHEGLALGVKLASDGEGEVKITSSSKWKQADASGNAVLSVSAFGAARESGQSILKPSKGDFLHFQGKLSTKAPASTAYKPSADLALDVRSFPVNPARSYIEAVASARFADKLQAASAPSIAVDASAGYKHMPSNPSWTAMFASAGSVFSWKSASCKSSVKLSARGRKYPHSESKSYIGANASYTVSPTLSKGHSLTLTAGAGGTSRPLNPPMSKVTGNASVKWSFSPASGQSAFRPSLDASMSVSGTSWPAGPTSRRSGKVSASLGASMPVSACVTMSTNASLVKSGAASEVDEDEIETQDTAGLTLSAGLTWLPNTDYAGAEPRVDFALKAVNNMEAGPGSAPWAASARCKLTCKF